MFAAGLLSWKNLNAFFHASHDAFEDAIDALKDDLPTLADHQVAVRLQKIVAMLE